MSNVNKIQNIHFYADCLPKNIELAKYKAFYLFSKWEIPSVYLKLEKQNNIENRVLPFSAHTNLS